MRKRIVLLLPLVALAVRAHDPAIKQEYLHWPNEPQFRNPLHPEPITAAVRIVVMRFISLKFFDRKTNFEHASFSLEKLASKHY